MRIAKGLRNLMCCCGCVGVKKVDIGISKDKEISMNSIGENCNDLKKQYDSCFLAWFSDQFLKGQTNDEMCAPYFKVYQQCVKKAMKENNIDLKEIEKNMLGSEEEQAKPPPRNS